jgi:hypothetical protein
MKSTKHYNCLACPQCSNPLHDPLAELELNKAIKTVKCDNCDFIGFREGWSLLNKEQENVQRQFQRTAKNTSFKISAYKGISA